MMRGVLGGLIMRGRWWSVIKERSCLDPVGNGRKRGMGLASYVAVIVPIRREVPARNTTFPSGDCPPVGAFPQLRGPQDLVAWL